MQALRFLLSPSGRLEPRAFMVAAVIVYALGVAAQWLTKPQVLLHAGVWPFAVAQLLLVWVWFALHARRLHDAHRPVDLAAGAALLYGLSIVLLLIVAIGYFKPVAGTESCQTHHVGTVTSGQLQLRHDDGTEVQVGPGDAYVIEPGHDAWVIGSEPFVAYEFDSSAAETYARG